MSELIDLALAPADLAGVEDLLTSLEGAMPFLVSLTAEEVKALFKLGPQSEAFVQKTIEAAEQHARLLPSSTPLAAMQRDVELREALRPLRARVAALLEKLDGTMILAGADLMKSASAVYRTLRIHGKGEGIEELLEDLGQRFAKRRRPVQAEPPVAQAPVAQAPVGPGPVAVEAVMTAPAALALIAAPAAPVDLPSPIAALAVAAPPPVAVPPPSALPEAGGFPAISQGLSSAISLEPKKRRADPGRGRSRVDPSNSSGG